MLLQLTFLFLVWVLRSCWQLTPDVRTYRSITAHTQESVHGGTGHRYGESFARVERGPGTYRRSCQFRLHVKASGVFWVEYQQVLLQFALISRMDPGSNAVISSSGGTPL